MKTTNSITLREAIEIVYPDHTDDEAMQHDPDAEHYEFLALANI